jgi:hypothetical protein
LSDLAAIIAGLRFPQSCTPRADMLSESNCGKPGILRHIEDKAHLAPHTAAATSGNPEELPSRGALQMQLALSQGTPIRHGGRMAAVCGALAPILLTAWSGLSAAAFAQSVFLPQTIGQGRGAVIEMGIVVPPLVAAVPVPIR